MGIVTVRVGNSESRIEGLTVEQFKALKKVLSYKIDDGAAYFSGRGFNPYRTLLGKRGDFPTGLLVYVQQFLADNKIAISTVDNRKRPASSVSFKLDLPYEPYKEQHDAVVACLLRNRGTVAAVTAFGKSITMALLVAGLGVKTLIVVPNLGLKEQLKASFRKYFGNLDNITIENIDSPKLKKPGTYDLLIVDECHHAAATTYRYLNKKFWNNIYFRFFFTGTPFRSRDEEQLLMESVTGQVIYRIDYMKAVQKGYVCPVEAYYYDLPRKAVEGYTWPQVYGELVVDNEFRNDLILEILTNLHLSGASTLCLVKEIRHGETLQELSPIIYPFVQGVNTDNADVFAAFNRGDEKQLIATTGVAGEGVDTKPAEYIIIAGLGKSRNSLIQQIGRGLRKSPGKESCKIILFRDASHKWTLAHFRAQVKVLREIYGVEPVKLDLPRHLVVE